MSRKLSLEFLAAVFLSSFMVNVAPIQALPINGVVYVPYSTNTPTIDGLWTTSTEWTDATMIQVVNVTNGWTFYLGSKYNMTHIFVLLDFVSDRTPSTHDFGGIFFDSKDDGGNLAGQDDYGFVIATGYPDLISIFQGTRMGNTTSESWTEILTRPYDELYRGGFYGVNDPYESRDHRIMEFAISRQWFKDAAIHYGFYAFVSDRHSGIPWPNSTRTLLEWPIGAGGENMEYEVWASRVPPAPEKWGDIVFYKDISALNEAYINLQNNLTALEKNYNASLVSNDYLQSTLDQIEANYTLLNGQFDNLQAAYVNTTYIVYSLLIAMIILAAIIVFLIKKGKTK